MIQFRKFKDNARIPTKATDGSAGYDIYSCSGVTIPIGGAAIVDTGLNVNIPKGKMGIITTRSGLGSKRIIVGNSPGIVDSDYDGYDEVYEVKVILLNLSDKEFTVNVGDRIAQMIFLDIADEEVVEGEWERKSSERQGGFGHTGR